MKICTTIMQQCSGIKYITVWSSKHEAPGLADAACTALRGLSATCATVGSRDEEVIYSGFSCGTSAPPLPVRAPYQVPQPGSSPEAENPPGSFNGSPAKPTSSLDHSGRCMYEDGASGDHDRRHPAKHAGGSGLSEKAHGYNYRICLGIPGQWENLPAMLRSVTSGRWRIAGGLPGHEKSGLYLSRHNWVRVSNEVGTVTCKMCSAVRRSQIPQPVQ